MLKVESLVLFATISAIVGNVTLAIVKIVVGFTSGSMAVLSDGFDSAVDILTSLLTLIMARVAASPPDKGHPYGHARAEMIATFVLGMLIIFTGWQLLQTSVARMFSSVVLREFDWLVFGVTLASVVGKIILATIQDRIGKRTHNHMLIANGKNMSNDVLTSLSVLVGLWVGQNLHFPFADPLLGALVSLWIIRSGVSILIELSPELMDGVRDQDLYNKIKRAVATIPGVSHPHRVRLRHVANRVYIELHIEVNGDQKLIEAHRLAQQVEIAIKKYIPDVADVMIHMEPFGNQEIENYCVDLDRI